MFMGFFADRKYTKETRCLVGTWIIWMNKWAIQAEPVVSNISVIPWQLVLLVTAQNTQITQNLGRKAQRYGRVKPVNGISFLAFL
jgi:hypothetical protein